MSNTVTFGRSGRVENETALQGSEAIEVDGFDDVDLEVPITAWPGMDVGLAGIFAMQAQGILITADQDCEALFLNGPYALEESTDYLLGANAFLEYVGDLMDYLFPGDILMLEGTAGDDNYYMIADEPAAYPALHPAAAPTVDFPGVVAANTDIFLANGHTITAVGPGAIGDIWRVLSAQHFAPRYDIALGALNVGPPGNIVWPGDLTEQFAVGDYFVITHGTNPGALPGHDGIYLIETIAFAGGNTTITIPLAQQFEEATADGLFHKVNPAFKLEANVPFLWTVKGGTNNPLQPFNTWTALQGAVSEMRLITTAVTNLNVRMCRNLNLP